MMSVKGVGKWKPTDICFGNVENLEVYGDHTMIIGWFLTGLCLYMLVLVNCYYNKTVKATPHLFHPFVYSALGS